MSTVTRTFPLAHTWVTVSFRLERVWTVRYGLYAVRHYPPLVCPPAMLRLVVFDSQVRPTVVCEFLSEDTETDTLVTVRTLVNASTGHSITGHSTLIDYLWRCDSK